MRTKGLTREQLKLLAIIAMVVDHTAWGFVDFMSPLGQIMHIFGRFTMPIMCFFVAEGYRHTKDLKRYVYRMISFALISVIPFYIFFHEEYGYRQNIIFDLLLALLALCAMEEKRLKKPVRYLIVGLLLLVSAVVGGWVIMPILYVLIFYYGKDFKQKARRFAFVTVLMEVTLIVLILLNQRYHFSGYEWTVEERIYLIFFLLALVPLSLYNGEKGKDVGGRYFFYAFYPCHFLVLAFLKYLMTDATAQSLYILAHVAALFIGLALLLYVIMQPSTRAQNAVTFFLAVGVMYIFGFLLEITTAETAGVYTATKLQYFAEVLVMIAITYCMQELCHTRIPTSIYVAEGVFSVFLMWCMFTYEKNGLMYSDISINTTAGAFPRMEIEGYGIAFYLFLIYCFLVCVMLVEIGIHSARTGGALQKKRLRYLLFAMLCMWVPYIIKATDLTNGYEIPALLIPFSAFFLVQALVRYSYLDSVTLGFSNAVDQGSEGMLIIDQNHRVLYHNEWIHRIFGSFSTYDDAYRLPDAKDAFRGKLETLDRNGHTYELRVEPLIEQGHDTGKILWVFDLTEHYDYLNQVEETATHDSLTGLNNRNWFENAVNDAISRGTAGGFFMADLDHFKNVNDTYGHQVGDEVLAAVSEAIRQAAETVPGGAVLSGRLGGDEFCLFYPIETEEEMLGKFAQTLIECFDEELERIHHKGLTGLSIGVTVMQPEERAEHYEEVYARADKALYAAKEAGRRTWRFEA